MINFDSLILKIFAQENEQFFIGAKIQKVQQPSRNELIFSIRNLGESRKFYINFNPEMYHLCFMSKQNEQKRNFEIPKTAPMFCMLLRKYIQNAKIIKVDVPKYERIFEIYFEYYDELNEKIQLCLAIELMGKHSNVILYNYDTNVIIGCAHNVSSEKSRERELYGLLPYIYPPKQKKKNLCKVSFESFKDNIENKDIAKTISSSYYFLTIPFVQDFIDLNKGNSLENLYLNLVNVLSLKKYRYFISKDYQKYLLYPYENVFELQSINELIDEYFSYHQYQSMLSNNKFKIFRYIDNQLKKLYSLKSKQEIQIQKIDKALLYKNKADIIMSNLYNIKAGLQKVKLFDFEGNLIEIDLEENKTPTENANRYYSLYKKTKIAYEHALEMVEETNQQILYFEEQKYFANKTDNIADLVDIYNELTEEKNIKTEKIQKVDFIEYEGVKIFVGKNKKQNDFILSHISSSEDLWFHALNVPGAHVLVKINNSKQEITDNILLKAAQITKEYSSQKDNSKTSIIYTKRKYVKKANRKLAFVTYKNESEIIV